MERAMELATGMSSSGQGQPWRVRRKALLGKLEPNSSELVRTMVASHRTMAIRREKVIRVSKRIPERQRRRGSKRQVPIHRRRTSCWYCFASCFSLDEFHKQNWMIELRTRRLKYSISCAISFLVELEEFSVSDFMSNAFFVRSTSIN